jgi:hypothetical protein
MSWQTQLNADPLPWLLEADEPGVRYLALRDLAKHAKPAELRAARQQAHSEGPIAAVLKRLNKAGYWAAPGPGYNPKYRATVWSIILLAQLGACADDDPRIAKACAYLLDHGLADGGQFTTSGASSGTADCLQGNLCWAMLELGYEDARLEKAFDWMARTVSGKCGPTFACGANNKLPCAWGGAKVMLALARLPKERRTPPVKRAIAHGIDFFFSVDPADATYPSGWAPKPSGNWWKFGFPVFYVTDLLQVAEALTAIGYGADPRLKRILMLIRDKQNADGRWLLEYDYAGKTWVDFGAKKEPNKWVTLRALRVLKAAVA